MVEYYVLVRIGVRGNSLFFYLNVLELRCHLSLVQRNWILRISEGFRKIHRFEKIMRDLYYYIIFDFFNI